jgi:hypothetical protein
MVFVFFSKEVVKNIPGFNFSKTFPAYSKQVIS